MSQIREYLEQNGPAVSEELDSTPVVYNIEGLKELDIHTSVRNTSLATVSNERTPVYYLEDVHTPREVIEKWIDNNESVYEEKSPWGLHCIFARYGDEFRKASKQVLDYENGLENGWTTDTVKNECPYCGEDITLLPDHIPTCPET